MLIGLPAAAGAAGAQDHSGHQHGPPAVPPPATVDTPPDTGDGSGTAWVPVDSPMQAVHLDAGAWRLMIHGVAFAQVFHEGGYFGGTQAGSLNWLMTSARRPLGKGTFEVRGMASLEPWTIRGCGYPDMLATGELCDDKEIHDKQHPHDVVMELAARYRRPLGQGLGVELYGGPSGEPALGPAAFPHRSSSAINPVAPVAHHWLDATHVSFGVASAGMYGRRWKVEGSVFNGREPDERRANLDLARLDSYSGRVSFRPTSRWALQVSGGHLREAEAAHEGRARSDVDLLTASATYVRPGAMGRLWASTLAWGRRAEVEEPATNFLLAETTLTLRPRDTLFARGELGTKTGRDISLHGLDRAQGMAKLQGGYVRSFGARKSWVPGIGGTISASIPNALIATRYGGRVTWGGGVFAVLRPSVMAHGTGHAHVH